MTINCYKQPQKMPGTSLGHSAAETSKSQKRAPITSKKGDNRLNDLIKMTTIIASNRFDHMRFYKIS